MISVSPLLNGDLTDPSYGESAVVERLYLASPRGYCAGVERAVDTVERALALYGRPVYVRKQIGHNSHVVRDLQAQGAVFVDSVADVPPGATLVFSAHGVAPDVRAAAEARQLITIDATCPLVTKVHAQARRYAEAGYAVVLIGHAGHEEVEGTMGEAPDHIQLVSSMESIADLPNPDGTVAYLTQTTLSVDDATAAIDRLRERFPEIVGPEYTLRGLDYILGTHPVSNLSYVSAVGTQSRLIGYGNNRADYTFIPGGVIPGVTIIQPDFPELDEGWPFLWYENEYVVDAATGFILTANAAEALTQQAHTKN